MITLDAIKGTWMDKPIKKIICRDDVPLTEAETKSVCQLPFYVRIPPSRGGKTRPNFIW